MTFATICSRLWASMLWLIVFWFLSVIIMYKLMWSYYLSIVFIILISRFVRVNSKELGCVSPSWNSSFEGILYWKQKVDSRLKRGCSKFWLAINYFPVFSEHWCRLKGNILILCRSPDRTSNEVSGVVLLERFTVSRTRDEEISYSFRLGNFMVQI